MSVAINILNPSDVWSRLSHILNCTNQDMAIQYTTIAEYIRAYVHSSTNGVDQARNSQSVHTNSILGAVNRDVGFLWDGVIRLPFKTNGKTESSFRPTHILRNLGTVGDLVKLGSGFWMSGPIRIVRLEEHEESKLLVVGGTPFEMLEMKFGMRMSCVCCARFFSPSKEQLHCISVENEIQFVHDWLGWPLEELSDWTKRMIRALDANKQLTTSQDASEFEIYAPDHIPGKPSFGNWVPIKKLSVVPSDLRLCRPPLGKTVVYDHPTYLTRFRNKVSRPVLNQLSLVPNDIYLRLMFGIEQMYNVKRTVSLDVFDHICRLNIPFKLPVPESRILAFGWPIDVDSNGRVSTYMFSSDLVPFLLQVMARLKLQIKVKYHKERVSE